MTVNQRSRKITSYCIVKPVFLQLSMTIIPTQTMKIDYALRW